MTAAEIAETLGDAALDGLGGAASASASAGSAGSGSSQPVRYERSRPGELVHIDVKKLGRIEGGAGKRVGATARASS